MKLAYGVSDFYKIMTNNYLYLDRTSYIQKIEDMGDQILFLRPRRFGKSLFLNTLENYYDIAKEKDFETLFGKLAIGKNPTPLRNKYFILTWDFSCVMIDGTSEEIKESLYSHMISTIHLFNSTYDNILPEKIQINEYDAISSFRSLLQVVLKTSHKLYLFIDEYDSFANSVLVSANGKQRYETLVSSDGLLRYIFRVIKSATKGGGLDRIFATGVSPIVMSDVSSGANILSNVSIHPHLTGLCGFTHSEVENVLSILCNDCKLSEDFYHEALFTMEKWYEGYRFDERQTEKIYNPTLCLYFFNYFKTTCEYPKIMLDTNLAPDDQKLQFIQSLPNGNALLWQLVQGHDITASEIIDKFGLNDTLNVSVQDMKSTTSYLW